jgi:Cytochrome P450
MLLKSSYHGRCLLKKKFSNSMLRLGVERLEQTVIMMSSTAVPKLQEKQLEAKPFSEMPGPKGLPFVGNILAMPSYFNHDEMYTRMSQMFEKYGPIYKEKIGSLEIVHSCDVGAVEKVHRLEGKYPRRIVIGAWTTWREEHHRAKGIIIGQV